MGIKVGIAFIVNSFSFFFSFAAKKLPIKVSGVNKKNQKKNNAKIFFISIAALDFSRTKVVSIIEYIIIAVPGKRKDVNKDILAQFNPPKILWNFVDIYPPGIPDIKKETIPKFIKLIPLSGLI